MKQLLIRLLECLWSKVDYCNLLINLLSQGFHAKNFAAADQENKTSTNQPGSSQSLKNI